MLKKQSESKARYKTIRNHPGIRKDLNSGRYIVTKSFKRKRHSKSFSKLSDAINWKNTFHPWFDNLSIPGEKTLDVKDVEQNGKEKGFYFRQIWELYKKNHLNSTSFSTQEVTIERARFYDGLMEMKMTELVPEFFDFYIDQKKELAILNDSKRFNFDDDLKRLKSVLNWYRENYDFTFVMPILKRHRVNGTLKIKSVRNKKLNSEQITIFFNNLEGVWKDLAICQFYLGARISEVAGLQTSNVDFENRSIEIKNVAVWERKTKKFHSLKELPKNGEVKFCFMNETLFEILSRRRNLVLNENKFLFHFEGMPLRYRQIQYQFDKALKKSGLFPEFSGTHLLRHSMATITRRVTKSLEATQAVTGHKDQRLVQHYATLPSEAQKKAVCDVEAYMNGLKHFTTGAELKLVE